MHLNPCMSGEDSLDATDPLKCTLTWLQTTSVDTGRPQQRTHKWLTDKRGSKRRNCATKEFRNRFETFQKDDLQYEEEEKCGRNVFFYF